MSQKYPKVSIIVVNWNDGEKIIRCLESIKELDYPSYEVIIIDNFSTDGSKEKIKKKFLKYKNFQMIENKKNLGCVKAINQGFKIAKSDLILRLDSDVILSKDLLKNLVEVILSDSKIGVVIPKVYYYKKPNIFCNIGFSINPITGKTIPFGINEKDVGQYEKQREVDYVPGAVLLTKKQVIKDAGFMSEDFFVYYEDADWCSKVRKAGYKIIYTPKTMAWHDCKSFFEFSPFRVHHYIRSKLLFMRRNIIIYQKLLFYPFFLFIYTPIKIIGFLIKGNFSLVLAYFKGLKEGFFNKIK